MLLINLKSITVTWLYNMKKFLWVIFNSLCIHSCLYPVLIHPYWDHHHFYISITFNCNDIAGIICSLDPNKAHGYDMISICMLKICDKSICEPLELIFQFCIKHGKFPNERKIANVVPVHKKNDKQILKNYWPVSLLPICGKEFS